MNRVRTTWVKMRPPDEWPESHMKQLVEFNPDRRLVSEYEIVCKPIAVHFNSATCDGPFFEIVRVRLSDGEVKGIWHPRYQLVVCPHVAEID